MSRSAPYEVQNTMRKYIAAVFLTLAMLLLSGCGARMTKLDYYNETWRCWEIYRDTNNELTGGLSTKDALLPNFRLGNAEDIARLEEIISRRDKALKDIEKLNPPKKYKDQHKKLVKGIKAEYKWDKTEADRDKVGEKVTAALDSLNWVEYFPSVYTKMHGELKTDLGLTNPW